LAEHPSFSLVFDESWYLARYPDVLNAGVSGAQHFLSSGVREWRNPSPFVDLRFVAEALPQALRDGPGTLRFLLDSGIDRGIPTSPYVDLAWRARQEGGQPGDDRRLFSALVASPPAERGDPCPWFDTHWYAQEHPEMRLAGLDPFEYFLAVGRWLHRFPHPAWDEDRYLGLNDYVRTAVGSGKYASGFEQFCAVGWTEVAREATALPILIGGSEEEFSESRYLAANADVRALIDGGVVLNGLEHLMRTGHREIAEGKRRLKDPSPLSGYSRRATGLDASGDILVLLNHYDIDGVIDPHVTIAIDAYRAEGADVVLISPDAALLGLDGHVTDLIVKSRNDDLRDFGGWHHAIEALGTERLSRYRRVVLTNDSVYFPVTDPGRLLRSLRESPSDVIAGTDSVSGGRYHLQSYFLGLSPRALSVLVPELRRRVVEQSEATKLTLIQRFEVGLSEHLIAHGLTTEVLYPLAGIPDIASALSPPDHREISKLAATVLNLTHHFWRAALAGGLPFLKVELLRENPVNADITGWQQMVTGPCTAATIEAHLARVRR
jgi:hypothetical protein